MDFPFPILFVGCADWPEFRDAAAWLSEHSAIFADNFPAALKLLGDGEISPALIVLAEFAPPRFSDAQLRALREAAPLAKIVRFLGPWFEGEIRTGQPLPATSRMYWHQWRASLQHALECLHESGFPFSSLASGRWLLPMTAGDDDRLLQVPQDAFSSDSPTRLIAIVARERETAQSLCDLCAQRGWKTMWLRAPSAETPLKVDAIVFDSVSGAAAELAAVADFKAISKGAPLVALCGFPRLDEIRCWQAVGASAVVSKPFLANELLSRIEQFLPQPAWGSPGST